jgi:hypothetical protein
MYLIHAQLRSPTGAVLPEQTAELLTACAFDAEGLEHVTVHPETPSGPVLGLFLTASGLDRAEDSALALCRRAVALYPQLSAFTVVGLRTALVPALWNALLAEDAAGRLMPLHDPSSFNPFHPF